MSRPDVKVEIIGVVAIAAALAEVDAVALRLTGVIRSMLVSFTPTDPLTFAGITALFIVIVVLSALVPAIRAARLDPVVAIRQG